MLDFVFWTVYWWIIGSLVRYLVKLPPKIDSMKQDILRERAIVEYHNYFISLIHAIFLLTVTGHSLLTNPWQDERPLSELETLAIKSSFCYFVYDTVTGFIYKYNEFWMNVHHIALFITYAAALQS